MAPVTNSRPGRLLLALLVLTLGLGVWAFWPGGDNNIRLGLDLRGGTQVILVPKPVQEGAVITEEQLAQTVAIIRQRVDGLGVAEAEVTTQGSGNNAAIVVSVPGVNQDRIVDLVQRTALLDFRPVYAVLSPVATDPTPPEPSAEPSPSASGSASDATTTQTPAPSASPSPTSTFVPTTSIVQEPENSLAFQEQLLALDCLEPEARSGGTPDDPTKWLGTCDQSGAAKYSLEPAFIKGTNVSGANAVLPQNGVGWVVSLEFDGEGAKALAEASTRLAALPDCDTGAAPCNAFAIVLDGVVVSAPRFNEPILGGQAQIEGQFTAQEAKDLASVLKYGALPVTLEPVDVTTVSPTVGNDQLRAGILAGLLGLALVMVYLLLYYRALGLVAVFSLIIAGGLVYLAFVILSKTVGLTLTLAGVAGAIVAIGITADSFIVYFERIRDEIRDGRTLRQACDSGWVRARRTLLAADFVSILAAVVLYFLSVGSVRGFAFVLGLTTLIDILVAFWFSHPLTVLLGRTRWMQRGSALTGLSANRIFAGATQDEPSPSMDRAGVTR
jgi:preprotein translocase subunit SecD